MVDNKGEASNIGGAFYERDHMPNWFSVSEESANQLQDAYFNYTERKTKIICTLGKNTSTTVTLMLHC